MLAANAYASDAEEAEYGGFLKRMVANFPYNRKLFTTSATGLFDTFLRYLPPERRQHYNCNACRRFVDHFGSLVTIDDDGELASAVWSFDAPGMFKSPVEILADDVRRFGVTGVFLSKESVLGTPMNTCPSFPGRWNHMHVGPVVKFTDPLRTASQAMAQLSEDVGILKRGLDDYSEAVVRKALALLKSGNLYRSEKCIGVAEWLIGIYESLGARPHRSANKLWAAVASAPAGYVHVRSTMIGTLLDDLKAGKVFADIKRSFDAKMAPMYYMRPVALPSAGNVAQAEAIVKKLGAERSLQRRFARLEDVAAHAIWTPKVSAPKPAAGVFGHLKTKSDEPILVVDQPAVTMTFEKFRRTILQTADKIELLVSYGSDGYFAFVTAVNEDAPCLFQWNSHVSWYVYRGGSTAYQWGLESGKPVAVDAVVFRPHMWADENASPHVGKAAHFVLRGAKDRIYVSGGGFSPENLKSEYHPIRSTMEQFARDATIIDKASASACGLMLQAGGQYINTFIVESGGIKTKIIIDRWD